MEIALSVAGLILTGVQVGSALHDFISNASNAPNIAQVIEDEIHDFTQILSRVQTITFGRDLDYSKASLIDINHLSSTLTASVRTFSELERELDRVKGRGKMDLWARAEKTFLFIIQRLQSHKSTFSVIITILTSVSSTETREALGRLAEQFESISTSLGNNASISDDLQSIRDPSQTKSTSNVSIRSPNPLPRRTFESALQLTHPYIRVRYSDSIYSKDSKQSYIGRWSLYSADTNRAIFNMPISLCEPPGITLADKDISTRLLPIAADSIYNHTRYQVHVGRGGPGMTIRDRRISHKSRLRVSVAPGMDIENLPPVPMTPAPWVTEDPRTWQEYTPQLWLGEIPPDVYGLLEGGTESRDLDLDLQAEAIQPNEGDNPILGYASPTGSQEKE